MTDKGTFYKMQGVHPERGNSATPDTLHLDELVQVEFDEDELFVEAGDNYRK